MTKEYFIKALNAELSYQEMDKILHYLYDMHDGKAPNIECNFYAPEIFISVCMKKIQGEIDDEYFETWLIIALDALNDEHIDLRDTFDGWAWNHTFSAEDCRSIISSIKDHDLKFRHKDFVKYHKKKKMKVIYLRFDFVDHSSDQIIYKCYIVDHEKKLYDVRMVDESMINYDLSKNYCIVVDEEWHADIKRQEDDESLDGIDCTKPEKQFCEAEDELIQIFFEKKYKRDKTLEL